MHIILPHVNVFSWQYVTTVKNIQFNIFSRYAIVQHFDSVNIFKISCNRYIRLIASIGVPKGLQDATACGSLISHPRL